MINLLRGNAVALQVEETHTTSRAQRFFLGGAVGPGNRAQIDYINRGYRGGGGRKKKNVKDSDGRYLLGWNMG